MIPQYQRLRRQLRSLSTPVVQIWGWPGSGQRAFLATLLEEEGERAVAVVDAWLSEPERLDELVRSGECRWLVYEGSVDASLRPLLSRIGPGQRLVVATESYRRDVGRGSTAVPPGELLLTSEEGARHWVALTDGAAEVGAAVWRRTEGWLRPFELVAHELVSRGEAPALEGLRVHRLPAVRSFLETRVLDPLTEEERDLLRDVALGGGADLGPAETGVVRRLVAERGLLREEAEGFRPPRLLADLLAEERGRERAFRRAGSEAREVISLRLLGSPRARRRVSAEAEEELRWPLRRAFLVLAFLATRSELQATRDELVDAVWPEADVETIRKNFHPTLSLLRRAFGGRDRGAGEIVEYRNGLYRLSRSVTWEVDVDRFSSLVSRGYGANSDQERVESWTRAWRLYGGPFLRGYEATWIVARREELERAYLDMLRELGHAYLRLGRAAEAEDALRTVLVEEPLQEEIHVAVMRIYAERGRRDLVRRQYERLCQLLAEELGVEPMSSTAAEFQRLMS